MIKWPSILPLPKIQTYTAQDELAKLRTEVEGGPARQRREFTQAPGLYTANFVLSNNDYAYFRGFWKYSILEGANWFEIRLDTGDLLTAGEPTPQSARFVGDYSSRRLGFNYWEVEGTLEVDNPSTMDSALILLLSIADDIFEMEELALSAETTLDALEQFMAGLP